MSLLYRSSGAIPAVDEKLCADLLLEETFSAIFPDDTRRRIFLAVLTNPLTDSADITRRAAILRDFTAAPNLLEALRTELTALAKLHATAQAERSHAYSVAKKHVSTATARELVMIGADTVRKALAGVVGIHTVLSMYQAASDGLNAVKARAGTFAALAEDADFTALCEALSRYGYAGETMPEIRIAVTEDGRVGACELSALHPIAAQETQKSSVLKKLFTAKAAVLPDPSVFCEDRFDHMKGTLLMQALTRTFELLDTLTRQIFDEFLPLNRELAFYEAASAYVHAFREKRIPLTTPTIAAENRITALYDPLLCTQRMTAAGIVSHDVSLASGAGVILTGENNSGKTVYLRSVGCAQLLFQAGLPIPAEAAEMRIFAAVRTGYAAAEKEFTAGNEAGRFEQEVREMAALVDSIRPDTLLLLNEIFQSTAYAEGAAGLYAILRYLAGKGTGFLLVTHLRELLPMMRNTVLHLQTGSGYTVQPADE